MTQFPLTAGGLRIALAALGGTPDVVASRLAAGGWRGMRASPCGCPVAVYLTDQFPGAYRVSVDSRAADLAIYDQPRIEVMMPDGVALFVGLFDRGESYDELALASDGQP